MDYATEGQTAIALQAFIPATGMLTFGDGQDSMTIRILIIDDTDVEEAEPFAVQLNEQLATAPVLDSSGVSSNGTAQNITSILRSLIWCGCPP